MSTSFYKRPLPTDLVHFASEEGRQIFQEALGAGTMAGYFALAEQFHTQADPAFCGLGTLVVVLNALAIDPGPERPWKGPWRWFSEEHLDCCRPLPDIQRTGLTIPQLACLARCNGARAEVQLAERMTVPDFRQFVREAATAPGEPHLVVSYNRASLGQTGAGHFSPVGGYHERLDLVLVLDVARFKYPPHWVPLEALFRAMLPPDAETGRSRGCLRFWRQSSVGTLYSLQATDMSWRSIVCELAAAEWEAAGSMEELLQRLLSFLPQQALALVQKRPFDPSAPSDVASAHAALSQELEHTEIMQLVRSGLPPGGADAAAVALLLLTLPDRLIHCLASPLRERMDVLRSLHLLPPALRREVDQLRLQVEALEESSHCSPGSCHSPPTN